MIDLLQKESEYFLIFKLTLLRKNARYGKNGNSFAPALQEKKSSSYQSHSPKNFSSSLASTYCFFKKAPLLI